MTHLLRWFTDLTGWFSIVMLVWQRVYLIHKVIYIYNFTCVHTYIYIYTVHTINIKQSFHTYCGWLRIPAPVGTKLLPLGWPWNIVQTGVVMRYRARILVGSSSQLFAGWMALLVILNNEGFRKTLCIGDRMVPNKPSKVEEGALSSCTSNAHNYTALWRMNAYPSQMSADNQASVAQLLGGELQPQEPLWMAKFAQGC